MVLLVLLLVLFPSMSGFCGVCAGLCRVERSRGKDAHWPTQLSFRIAPRPASRAFGLRQRSKEATDRRNKKKAERGYLPLAKRHSFGRSSGRSSGV
jgi:hypothetical protein